MRWKLLGAENFRIVSNETYFDTLLRMIRNSLYSFYAGVFIFDVITDRDQLAEALQICFELKEAVWRGVDVRIIVGGSLGNSLIDISGRTVYSTLEELHVPCHHYRGKRSSGFHAKFAVTDSKNVLLGSHNWTHWAFRESVQHSGLLISQELAKYLEDKFRLHWLEKPSIQWPETSG